MIRATTSAAEAAQLALATRILIAETHRAIQSCRRATAELGHLLRSARELTKAAVAILKQHRVGLVTDPHWVENYLRAGAQEWTGRCAESLTRMPGWVAPVYPTQDCPLAAEFAQDGRLRGL